MVIRFACQVLGKPAVRTVLVVSLLGATHLGCARPGFVYLLYPGDPSTSITVGYQTSDLSTTSKVYYDSEPRGGDVDAYAFNAIGTQTRVSGLPVTRTIHHVTLTDLLPGTTYYFIAGDEKGGYSPERFFRTIPSDDRPLRFVAGGDMGATSATRALLRVAGQQDPDFAVVGGDIAYANGEPRNYRAWEKWFQNWDELMRAPDGRLIPIVAAIGNHEVNDSGAADPSRRAPFYFAYFGPQAGGTFFDRAFGANMALAVLDSGHIAPHDGAQATWLDDALSAYDDLSFTFAVYHVPLYPSHRDFDGSGSVAGREHWAPLFDAHHLTAAFENHDHTMKRTKRIRDNEVNPEGVLFLGDGSWGVVPREVDPERRWYEEVAVGVGHVWIVDVTADETTFRAIDANGSVLDETTSMARTLVPK